MIGFLKRLGCIYESYFDDSHFKASQKQILFGHINACGIGENSDSGIVHLNQIQGIMLRRGLVICSVVETHLIHQARPELCKHFDWVGYGRNKGWGGTGIIFHRYLNCVDMTKKICGRLKLECTFVSFQLFSKTFLFGSVYLPNHPRNSEVKYCIKVLKKISGMDFDFVSIAGDFNAWHPAWGRHPG